MSQENLDCLLRAIDAFNQRERNAFLALMDSDVEAESRLAAVEGGYHGQDGVIRWWNNLLETFPDYSLEVEEPRDLDDAQPVGGKDRPQLACALARARAVPLAA